MSLRLLPATAVVVASLALAGPAAGKPAKAAKASPAYVEQVRATVDQHLEELVPCMDANKTKRGTRVKLQVQMMILSDGAVLSARRGGKARPADAAIEGCMLAKVKTWRFPGPADRQTVAVDFPIEMEMAQ